MGLLQMDRSSQGDHRRIVGTVANAREMHLRPRRERRLQLAPKQTIGTDATGHDELSKTRLLQCPPGLFDEGVDDGLLEAGGQIGAALIILIGEAFRLQSERRLQSAETEV